jgi:transketolase
MTKIESYGSKPTRDGFGLGLGELGEKDERIVVIGADVSGSVKTSYFQDKFPERFISVGVAEQNATTVAVGLALSGKIPFFSSYSAFAAFRNADQIRVSICYNDANVKIGGGHSGLTVGPDGATHQSLEVVAFLRTLPNMTLICPADYEQAKKATIAIGEMVGPAYLRFGRPSVPMFTKPEDEFIIGKADLLREGTDVSIVANGIMVWEALIAAEALKEKHNINAEVINCHTIKPIDEKALVNSARKCGAMVAAEEHQVHGGLGGAVAEVLVKNYPIPMEFVGVKDTFGGSGEPFELTELFGLTWKEIYASALLAIDRKNNGSSSIRKVKDVAVYTDGM